MGLPKIPSYALPADVDLAPARVGWSLDPARAALLVHDLQNYFVASFETPSPLVETVVAHINSLRDACATAGVPVFFSAQPGAQDPRDRGLQRDFWGPGMTDAPEHRAIDARVAPRPGDIVLEKWRYSAFQRTTLESMLRARGRDQLIITGVYAHIGCLLTAADGFMRDIEPFLVADALGDFSRAHHDRALEYAASRCAVVTTTARARHALEHRR